MCVSCKHTEQAGLCRVTRGTLCQGAGASQAFWGPPGSSSKSASTCGDGQTLPPEGLDLQGQALACSPLCWPTGISGTCHLDHRVSTLAGLP